MQIPASQQADTFESAYWNGKRHGLSNSAPGKLSRICTSLSGTPAGKTGIDMTTCHLVVSLPRETDQLNNVVTVR